MTSPKIERALISVSDKSGLIDFARALIAAGVEIYASGGTRRHLEEAGIAVREVAAYTGFPEMMDGRIKTLHPKIHGGILCRRDNPADMAAIAEQGIVPFELVVVNLYPFQETVAREGVTIEEAIEQIDIGGPTLIRAAAKNHAFVTIACEPSQYSRILNELRASGTTTLELRRGLATAAFVVTASYDTSIARYFARRSVRGGSDADRSARGQSTSETPPTSFSEHLAISLRRGLALRYGENPHQSAALYQLLDVPPGSLARAEQLHGKEL